MQENALLDVRGLNVEIATDRGILRPVRDVSLHVRRGEAHAIVGESGCGKSLTSLALLGLLPANAKSSADCMSLEGTRLDAMSERAWRKIRGRRIAMIFQDPMTSLDPLYRIGDQLIEVLRQHKEVSISAARAQAAEKLGEVGISQPEERLDQYPHQLSGGLRQRVMIAMALLCTPDLLIADEPTTALDVTVQLQILKLLRQIISETHIGLMLITHDLGVVASIADTTSIMYGGQVVENGPTDDVLSRPLHPYTEGLLGAIPIPGRTKRGERLGSIPGTVPPQIGELTRCGFIERCAYATAACNVAVPLRTESQQNVRCVLPGQVSRLGTTLQRAIGGQA